MSESEGSCSSVPLPRSLAGTDRTRKSRYSYTSNSIAYIRRISEKLSGTISTALRFTFRRGQRRRRWQDQHGSLLRDPGTPSSQSPSSHYHQHRRQPPHNLWPSHRNQRAQPNQFNVKLSPAGNCSERVSPPASHAMTRRFPAKFIFNALSDKRSAKVFCEGSGRKHWRGEVQEIIRR